MTSIYKSGAFAQQCFALHRENLSFRTLELPARVVLDCTSCEMEHRLEVSEFTSTLPREIEQAGEHLSQCVTAHGPAIRVSAMDVVRDYVGARCSECNRSFELSIETIETVR